MDAVTLAAAKAYAKRTFVRDGVALDSAGTPYNVLVPPRDLPSVVAWYDASTLLGADGSKIQSWPDLGPLKQDLLQLTAGNQPTVKTNGPNGLRYLQFGTSAFMTRSSFGGTWMRGTGGYAQPLTFIAVCRGNTTAPAGNRVCVGTAGQADLRLEFTGDTAAIAAGATGAQGGAPCNDGNWHVLVGVLGTTFGAVWRDGYLVGSATTQSHSTGTLTTMGASSSSLPFDGDIAEIIVCNAIVGRDKIGELTQKLAAKWGITSTCRQRWDTVTQDTTSSNGQNIRVFSPPVDRLTTTTPVVLMSHPYTYNEQFGPGTFGFHLLDAAVQQGWLAGASRMHSDSWGNNNALADLADLLTFINSRYGLVNPPVILIGMSMGGLPSALAVANGTIANIKGVYLVDAFTNLSDAFAGNAGTFSASIRTAYGIAADGSDYASKTAGHDPNLISAATYGSTVRWRMLASTTDASVTKANNSDAFATLLSGTAPEASQLTHFGTHLAYPGLQPSDFLAFTSRCGLAAA